MTDTTPDTRALEATVAKLTARAPHKLFDADSDRAQERFNAELARQLARLGDDEYGDDVRSYLDEVVFYAEDADDVVVTDSYIRNAGMASGYYVALKALRLPSGAT